jgi:hypothetical protein
MFFTLKIDTFCEMEEEATPSRHRLCSGGGSIIMSRVFYGVHLPNTVFSLIPKENATISVGSVLK